MTSVARLLCLVTLVTALPSLARAACGDGLLDGTDACDDGNTRAGDGCSVSCTVEADAQCATLNALSTANPGFETDDVGSGAWKVVSGTVDRVDGTASGDCMPAGEGRYSIDLNGSSKGVLAQSFDTVVGRTYGVVFLASANCIEVSGQSCTRTCARVLTVGVADDTGAPDADDLARTYSQVGLEVFGSPKALGWVPASFTFTARSTRTLLFFSGGLEASFAGPMIDDVKIPTSLCTRNTCGNGAVDGDETCDDGNDDGGDGCSGQCALESGYACTDSTSPMVCTPVCGDDLTVGEEQCDDGGTGTGDGCDEHCRVESGYACTVTPPATGSDCVLTDACQVANGGCDANATCGEIAGVLTCTCRDGFTGDGTTCAAIGPCDVANGGCDANATCTPDHGLPSCACKPGFTGNGVTCEPANPCDTANGGCDANALCTNDGGTARCACKEGYVGDGTTCTLADPCATDNGGCDVHADCVANGTTPSCTCKTGYSGDGVTCSWQSRCPDACPEGSTCTDPGEGQDVACKCPTGFEYKNSRCEITPAACAIGVDECVACDVTVGVRVVCVQCRDGYVLTSASSCSAPRPVNSGFGCATSAPPDATGALLLALVGGLAFVFLRRRAAA